MEKENIPSIGGINVVRQPLLSFKTKKKNDDYTEYEIITDKTNNEIIPDTNAFNNYLNSMIFCNDTITIKHPSEKYMIKDGKKRFAYAIGMFPNPKNGKAAYLDGCILAALGLKRQKTNADVICFITHDISLEDKERLDVVFDKVMYVPYISPFDMGGGDADPKKGENLETIMMDPDLFKNCPNYTKNHPYTHVFFKLHIFNPKLFPYEKVCFVDSDLVPMNYYDSLFMLDCPAGFVEYRKKIPYLESFNWDRCDFLEHGKPIPKELTDVDKPTGADVNAGLLLVEPNKKEYESMIKELTSKVDTWMGEDKFHKGFYSFDFNKPYGRSFVKDSYCYPEQNYLTKRFSGKWKYIEFAFQSWGLDPCNSFGIHMAAFNPKPWFKQPIGTTVKVKDKYDPYNKKKKDKKMVLPLALDTTKSKNYENITYSYEIFNEVIIWGMVNYPKLIDFFTKDVEIHGTKISFDQDTFEKLSDDKKFKLLKNIDEKDEDYKKLSLSQKYISDLMNDKDNAIESIKGKYLQICKSSKLRKGDGKYDYQIITYPDYSDLSEHETKEYLREEKMPFGKHKGKLIKNLSEEYIITFINSNVYKLNKKLKDVFKKHHKDIINNQKGGDYIDDRLAAIKSELRKDDIINYCKKYVNYKKAMGETVSLQECYKKQLEGDTGTGSPLEDRSITEDEIRGKLLTFAEENNTKENNPVFHSRLVKLIETLNDEKSLLSKKLLLFLIEIGELDNKSTGSTVSSGGAKKKKSKRTKKKSRKAKKKSRRTKKKSKRTKKKSKKAPASKCKLLYFTMNGCPYCEEFNPVWDNLIDLVPKLETKKIERFENPEMIQDFKIESFPNIILMKNNNKELYEGHRDTDTLMGFLKSNITNMV
tara:strand:- start:266 stop:2881 length:2616 start_codon:yes stop_codon:yes gene_type:complete